MVDHSCGGLGAEIAQEFAPSPGKGNIVLDIVETLGERLRENRLDWGGDFPCFNTQGNPRTGVL